MLPIAGKGMVNKGEKARTFFSRKRPVDVKGATYAGSLSQEYHSREKI